MNTIGTTVVWSLRLVFARIGHLIRLKGWTGAHTFLVTRQLTQLSYWMFVLVTKKYI